MPSITIIRLQREEFVIEPVKDSYRLDNSIELRDLKRELKQLELTEGEDYEVETSKYSSMSSIKFQGASRVVRALWTIPQSSINLGYSYSQYSESTFNQVKLSFATKISRKECTVHDEQFVQKAHASFYEFLKDEVKKVHAPELKSTPVMQQLDRDLVFIETTVTENAWQRPRSHLAMASLVKAYKDEEAKPSLVAPGFSIFTKPSLLLPKYLAILHTICEIQGTNLDRLCTALISDYNVHVAAKQKEVAFKATIASAKVS